jgi:ubiquitin-conjugating enzyme E2 D/E
MMCDFISDFNEFTKHIDKAKPEGGTALFDCLDLAINSLVEIKKQHPDIILRIIALTDGEDQHSTNTA